MHFPASLAIVASLATTILGAPNPGAKPKSFSLKQVRQDNFVPNGPMAVAKTCLKYGKPVPQNIKDAIAVVKQNRANNKRASSGSVVTTNEDQYDSQYLTPVSIGTPAQLLNLNIDTGSADLWVFSTETISSAVSGQTVYDPSKSSTSSLKDGYTWEITYGDQSTSGGVVYSDVVTMAGITFETQAVEAATNVSSSFTSNSKQSGLLGLSLDSVNTVKPTSQLTWFSNVKSSLASPVFTADLGYHAPGSYDFGIIDSSKYTGDITYTPISTAQGFWEITATGYGVGSGSIQTVDIDTIVDTGTALLYLPADIATAYWAQVSGSEDSSTYGGYVFDCSAASSLPDFKYQIGTATYTLPGSYINFAPADDAGTKCFGGLQPNTDVGLSIFGDILMKSAFIVFDGENNQVGFAAKAS